MKNYNANYYNQLFRVGQSVYITEKYPIGLILQVQATTLDVWYYINVGEERFWEHQANVRLSICQRIVDGL